MGGESLLGGLEALWTRIHPEGEASQLDLPPELSPAEQLYEKVETLRLRIGQALTQDRPLTRRLADDVLALLTADKNLTNQLVFPLVKAIGRRSVLSHLIPAIREGEWPASANASSAAYWVKVWEPRPSSVDRQIIDRVADLWPELWRASLEAFVHCTDVDLQQQLHTAFPLDSAHYPPDAAPLLRQARSIAMSHPQRFHRLLAGSTGYGLAI